MEYLSADSFQRRQAWRSGLALRLRLLDQWCQSHALLSTAATSRLADVQRRLLSDSLTIAFVGEMGRGKSELINAIFFGTYKYRVLPVGPGHSTLCTLEISHEDHQEAYLRLLPTETGADPRAIREWQNDPTAWTRVKLVPDNAEHMGEAMDRIRWRGASNANASPAAAMPRWRHAIMNLPLSFLEQGLRILDTPGLNAPGARPEPTLDLLSSCDLIVFLLSADTGLTASELAFWQNHLVHHAASGGECLVILNKADALWDPLTDASTIERQRHQQRLDVAALLGIQPQCIFTVSAQNGFAAKVTEDGPLLARSGLPGLEEALVKILYVDRHGLWQRSLERAFGYTKTDIENQFCSRGQEIARKRKQVLDRVQLSADASHDATAHKNKEDPYPARIKAIHSILQKHIKKIGVVFQQPARHITMRQLESALRASGGIGSVQQAYAHFQQTVRQQWEPVAAHADEMNRMLASALPTVIADPVHALHPPRPPQITLYETELDQAIAGHLQFLGNSQLHRLRQSDFTRHLSTELHSRVSEICQKMQSDFEDWNGQMQAYMQRDITGRLSATQQALELGRQAAAKARQELAELQAQEDDLQHLRGMLNEHFLNLQEANADY